MSQTTPPNPRQFRSLQDWAQQMHEYLLAETPRLGELDPSPVLLSHKSNTEMERAAQSGVLLYDPIMRAPVYSEGGIWRPISMDFGIFLVEQEINRRFGDTVSVLATCRRINKFGRNTDLDTGVQETVWSIGGDEAYLAAGVNTIDTIVSSSASDTSTLNFTGFTDAGGGVLTRVTGTVTLNGTTNVSLPTSLNRIERIAVADGEPALVGNVVVTDNGAGTSHIEIEAGNQQSYKCAFSTASNEYVIIEAVETGIARNNTSACDFSIEDRIIGSVFRPMTGRFLRNSVGTTNSESDGMLIVRPNSDVRVTGISSANNVQVSATVRGYYAEIQ